MPVVRLVRLTRWEILLRVDDTPCQEIEVLLAHVQPAGLGDDFAAWVRRRWQGCDRVVSVASGCRVSSIECTVVAVPGIDDRNVIGWTPE